MKKAVCVFPWRFWSLYAVELEFSQVGKTGSFSVLYSVRDDSADEKRALKPGELGMCVCGAFNPQGAFNGEENRRLHQAASASW